MIFLLTLFLVLLNQAALAESDAMTAYKSTMCNTWSNIDKRNNQDCFNLPIEVALQKMGERCVEREMAKAKNSPTAVTAATGKCGDDRHNIQQEMNAFIKGYKKGKERCGGSDQTQEQSYHR